MAELRPAIWRQAGVDERFFSAGNGDIGWPRDLADPHLGRARAGEGHHMKPKPEPMVEDEAFRRDHKLMMIQRGHFEANSEANDGRRCLPPRPQTVSR